ncbi:hypothetical protein [Streptomyces sp. MH13]|uniref:hypothetical protein n=1 Tax=Streptomyces sp. MH13 TaxID=3417651 RepID=UPI003CF57F6E
MGSQDTHREETASTIAEARRSIDAAIDRHRQAYAARCTPGTTIPQAPAEDGGDAA